MAAKLPFESLEQEVTCSICLDQYQDPRILPCLHTYCRKCLEGLLEKESVQCPLCRIISQVKDVSSLQVNIWINNRLSLFELSKAEKQSEGAELQCGNCHLNKQAIAKCFDCEALMCETCTKAHQLMTVLKSHQLLTLEEIKRKGIPSIEKTTLCSKHSSEKQKLFCEDCETLICRDCTIIDHKDHNFGFIADVVEEQKRKLQRKMQDLRGIKNKIESALKAVEDMQGRVKRNEETLKKEIDSKIDANIAMLERTRAQLKQKSTDLTATKMKRLTLQQDGLEMHLAALTNAINFTENILDKGSSSDVLSLVKQINSRSSEVMEKEIDGDVDEENKQILEVDIENCLAIQDTSAPDLQKCTASWINDTNIQVVVRNYLNTPINIRASRIQINAKCSSISFSCSKRVDYKGQFMITGSFKRPHGFYSRYDVGNYLHVTIDEHSLQKLSYIKC